MPSLIEAHSRPALPHIAWLQEHDTGRAKSILNRGQGARLRVGDSALDVLDRDFGNARRLGQLGLLPADKRPGRTDLGRGDHSRNVCGGSALVNHDEPHVYFYP